MTLSRLLPMLPLLGATLMPLPALASGTSLADIYERYGMTLTWASEATSPTGTQLSEVTLSSPEMTILMAKMDWSSVSGALWIERGEILAREGGASPVLFTGAGASGPLTLVAVAGQGLCTHEMRAQGNLEMIYTGLSIRAMPSTLPWDHPMERLEAAEAVVTFAPVDDGRCLGMNGLAATDISGRGQDRSRITIASMEIAAEASGPLTLRTTLSARNFAAFDPQGANLGTMGRINLDMLVNIPEPASYDEADMIDAVSAGRSRFSLDAREIYLPVDRLAGDLAPEPGLVADAMISGHVSLTITHENDAIALAVDTDLRGLGMALGTLDLQILPADAVVGIGALFGGNRPGLATAERLAIVGMQMSVRDLGALALAGALRGQTLEQVRARLDHELSIFPQALRAPVLAFIERALDGGASVSASPAAPVGLAEIGMAAVLAPARIEAMLVLETD